MHWIKLNELNDRVKTWWCKPESKFQFGFILHGTIKLLALTNRKAINHVFKKFYFRDKVYISPLSITRARLWKRKAIRETNTWTCSIFATVAYKNRGSNILLSCETVKQANQQQTYFFKPFMSSSLYLVKIRFIFSQQRLPFSSTVYESIENAFLSLLATAFHPSGFSGLCWATSLARANS